MSIATTAFNPGFSRSIACELHFQQLERAEFALAEQRKNLRGRSQLDRKRALTG